MIMVPKSLKLIVRTPLLLQFFSLQQETPMSLFCSLCILIATCFSLDSSYFYDEIRDFSNVFAAAPYNESSDWVTFLGKYNTVKECVTACADKGSINNRCQSYTYMTPNYYSQGYQKNCYGLFGQQYGSVWSIVPDNGSISGQVVYPCQDEMDCSLNGKCDKSTGYTYTTSINLNTIIPLFCTYNTHKNKRKLYMQFWMDRISMRSIKF